jgi:hypothetical protein
MEIAAFLHRVVLAALPGMSRQAALPGGKPGRFAGMCRAIKRVSLFSAGPSCYQLQLEEEPLKRGSGPAVSEEVPWIAVVFVELSLVPEPQ